MAPVRHIGKLNQQPQYAATKTKEASRGRVDRENPQADGAAVAHHRRPDQVQARARAGKTAPRAEIRELLMPTPVNGQIRVGIIGAGLIGQTHSMMLRYVADRTEQSVRVVSVADVSHRAAEQLAARWHGRARARVGRRDNRGSVDRRGMDLHADRDASPGLYRRRARRQTYFLREAARDDRGGSIRDGGCHQSVRRDRARSASCCDFRPCTT